jgi:hypothetical protein
MGALITKIRKLIKLHQPKVAGWATTRAQQALPAGETGSVPFEMADIITDINKSYHAVTI